MLNELPSNILEMQPWHASTYGRRMDAQANAICRSCNYQIRAFRQIRQDLYSDLAKTVSCCIVGSRLDYCNSLLYGISAKKVQKLQRVQNNLARITLMATRAIVEVSSPAASCAEHTIHDYDVNASSTDSRTTTVLIRTVAPQSVASHNTIDQHGATYRPRFSFGIVTEGVPFCSTYRLEDITDRTWEEIIIHCF